MPFDPGGAALVMPVSCSCDRLKPQFGASVFFLGLLLRIPKGKGIGRWWKAYILAAHLLDGTTSKKHPIAKAWCSACDGYSCGTQDCLKNPNRLLFQQRQYSLYWRLSRDKSSEWINRRELWQWEEPRGHENKQGMMGLHAENEESLLGRLSDANWHQSQFVECRFTYRRLSTVWNICCWWIHGIALVTHSDCFLMK